MSSFFIYVQRKGFMIFQFVNDSVPRPPAPPPKKKIQVTRWSGEDGSINVIYSKLSLYLGGKVKIDQPVPLTQVERLNWRLSLTRTSSGPRWASPTAAGRPRTRGPWSSSMWRQTRSVSTNCTCVQPYYHWLRIRGRSSSSMYSCRRGQWVQAVQCTCVITLLRNRGCSSSSMYSSCRRGQWVQAAHVYLLCWEIGAAQAPQNGWRWRLCVKYELVSGQASFFPRHHVNTKGLSCGVISIHAEFLTSSSILVLQGEDQLC